MPSGTGKRVKDSHVRKALGNRQIIGLTNSGDQIRRDDRQKQSRAQNPRYKKSNQSNRRIINTKPSIVEKAKFVASDPVGNVDQNCIEDNEKNPTKRIGSLPGSGEPQDRSLQALHRNAVGSHATDTPPLADSPVGNWILIQ
jgi:hypothetical protein